MVEQDLDDMYELDADPEVHRFLGNNPVQDREQSREIIRNVRRQYRKNGIGRWAITDDRTNEFFGWAGLKYEQAPVNGRNGYYDLGYRIKRKYWGQGIATETAIASLHYGFRVMQLPEICAAAHIDNHASNAVLRKAGFTFVEQFDLNGLSCNWYSLEREYWMQNLLLKT